MNHLPARLMYRAAVRLAIAAAVCSTHAEVILFAAIAGGALWLIH